MLCWVGVEEVQGAMAAGRRVAGQTVAVWWVRAGPWYRRELAVGARVEAAREAALG